MSTEPNASVIAPAPYQPPEQREAQSSRLRVSTIVLLVVGAAAAAFLWFIFTAKSVRIIIEPTPDTFALSGGFQFALGKTWLLREGRYRIQSTAVGYEPLDVEFDVASDRNQLIELAMDKLPGRVTFTVEPDGTEVFIDGTSIGNTPLPEIQIAAGEHELLLQHPLYFETQQIINIDGMDTEQAFTVALEPNYGTVAVATEPVSAAVTLDDSTLSEATPAVLQLPPGDHVLQFKAPGYKRRFADVSVSIGEEQSLPTLKLSPADGLVSINSSPSGAGVTVGGQFRGSTPLEIELTPGRSHQLRVFKAGFKAIEQRIEVASGAEESLSLRLSRLTGTVEIVSKPAGATVLVDGQARGTSPLTLTLPAKPHVIQLRLDGYAGFRKRLEPKADFRQSVNVALLTEREARLAALKPSYETSAGQAMKLMTPTTFTMGASRREPGRRSNETLRSTRMTRLYYLSEHEVTNAQFRAFATGHDSGEFEENTLNKDDQPVVDISWHDAAGYANWLSKQEQREPYYEMEFGKVTGVNPSSLGYRLPMEAEWAWAARAQSDGSSARFAWGPALPPPERFANLADRSAAHVVGRIVFGYNDNYVVSAPVGSFAADAPLANPVLHDMAGNVAEWMHDYYEIGNSDERTDPTGPAAGEYRVIRGSSWKHGTMTDTRLSFRDYGIDGREDIGFRLARYAE
ncbi:MAG: PEGA domain-containing protein [Pseudomonadaceae bacterium]|nr:PEGA domain-containing protein [Pseudomonadaceae bacterium]